VEATRRGESADWTNVWPVVGVQRGDAAASPGADLLRSEGFRAVFDVEPVDADRDDYQDHLNNTAAVRMFNELRIAYVATFLAPDWVRYVRRSGHTVVVREMHALYESEGWMHERFVGGIRWAERRGKAGLVEQRLVETTTGRALARAWVVQLLVTPEGVAPFPEWFWDMVATVEGAPVPTAEDAARTPWGPPSP
jgi:acyl-CoA thioesterase FadM